MQFCQGIPYPQAACRDRPSPPPLIQRAAVNGLLPDRDADRHMSTFPHCTNGKDRSGHGIQCQLRNRDVPVHQYIRCKRFRHRLIPPSEANVLVFVHLQLCRNHRKRLIRPLNHLLPTHIAFSLRLWAGISSLPACIRILSPALYLLSLIESSHLISVLNEIGRPAISFSPANYPSHTASPSPRMSSQC